MHLRSVAIPVSAFFLLAPCMLYAETTVVLPTQETPCPGGSHLATVDEENSLPQGTITAGQTIVCDRDTRIVNPTVGQAREYLKSLRNSEGQCKSTSDNSFEQLDPDFAVCAARFLKAIRLRDQRVFITSAYRSAEQQQCICKYTTGPCAAPGKSNHQKGIAIDIVQGDSNTLEPWIHTLASSYGITFPYANDDGHFQPATQTCGSDVLNKSLANPLGISVGPAQKTIPDTDETPYYDGHEVSTRVVLVTSPSSNTNSLGSSFMNSLGSLFSPSTAKTPVLQPVKSVSQTQTNSTQPTQPQQSTPLTPIRTGFKNVVASTPTTPPTTTTPAPLEDDFSLASDASPRSPVEALLRALAQPDDSPKLAPSESPTPLNNTLRIGNGLQLVYPKRLDAATTSAPQSSTPVSQQTFTSPDLSGIPNTTFGDQQRSVFEATLNNLRDTVLGLLNRIAPQQEQTAPTQE